MLYKIIPEKQPTQLELVHRFIQQKTGPLAAQIDELQRRKHELMSRIQTKLMNFVLIGLIQMTEIRTKEKSEPVCDIGETWHPFNPFHSDIFVIRYISDPEQVSELVEEAILKCFLYYREHLKFQNSTGPLTLAASIDEDDMFRAFTKEGLIAQLDQSTYQVYIKWSPFEDFSKTILMDQLKTYDSREAAVQAARLAVVEYYINAFLDAFTDFGKGVDEEKVTYERILKLILPQSRADELQRYRDKGLIYVHTGQEKVEGQTGGLPRTVYYFRIPKTWKSEPGESVTVTLSDPVRDPVTALHAAREFAKQNLYADEMPDFECLYAMLDSIKFIEESRGVRTHPKIFKGKIECIRQEIRKGRYNASDIRDRLMAISNARNLVDGKHQRVYNLRLALGRLLQQEFGINFLDPGLARKGESKGKPQRRGTQPRTVSHKSEWDARELRFYSLRHLLTMNHNGQWQVSSLFADDAAELGIDPARIFSSVEDALTAGRKIMGKYISIEGGLPIYTRIWEHINDFSQIPSPIRILTLLQDVVDRLQQGHITKQQAVMLCSKLPVQVVINGLRTVFRDEIVRMIDALE